MASDRNLVALHAYGVEAAVAPHAGGRLASLRIAGDEVLVTDAPPRVGHDWEWGCFPLAPWAGIQRGAAFEFDGRRHLLEQDAQGEAWHGLVAERTWTVVSRSTSSVALEIEIGPEMDAAWFARAVVRQNVALTPHDLTIRLEVVSQTTEMPVILGLHPWFRRRIGGGREATVGFTPSARLLPGDDGVRRPVADFGGRPWDDLFTGVKEPVVSWTDGPKVALRSDAPVWVYYDRAADGFCVEPWTDTDDALSRTRRRAAPGSPAVLELTFAF